MKTQTQPGLDQPWLKNRRWASGRICDQSNVFIFFSVLFSLVLNTIAWLAAVAAWRDRTQGLAVLIFPLILVALGVALLAWTVRQLMMRLKFGRSVFELETFPGAVGGWLAGTVRARIAFDTPKGIRLELECVARVTTRDFNNKSSTHEDILLVGKQSLSRNLPREGVAPASPLPSRYRLTPSPAGVTETPPSSGVFALAPANAGRTTTRPSLFPSFTSPTPPLLCPKPKPSPHRCAQLNHVWRHRTDSRANHDRQPPNERSECAQTIIVTDSGPDRELRRDRLESGEHAIRSVRG